MLQACVASHLLQLFGPAPTWRETSKTAALLQVHAVHAVLLLLLTVLLVLYCMLQGSVLSDLDDLRSSMAGGSSWFGFGTAMGPDRYGNGSLSQAINTVVVVLLLLGLGMAVLGGAWS